MAAPANPDRASRYIATTETCAHFLGLGNARRRSDVVPPLPILRIVL